MSRHWFVRHGESVANAERWLAGHRDVPLTARGEEQARALRAALAGVSPDRVVSSDLLRARHTARLAWEGRSPEALVAPELRERHLGAWEGARVDDLVASGDMAALLSWDRGPPGGESHLTLAIRILRYLSAADDGADVVWFGHGGWIRTIAGLLDGTPLEAIGAHKVGNAEVVAREAPPGTWARLLAQLGVVDLSGPAKSPRVG